MLVLIVKCQAHGYMTEVPCQSSVLVTHTHKKKNFVFLTLQGQCQAIDITISDPIHKDLGSGIPDNNVKDLWSNQVIIPNSIYHHHWIRQAQIIMVLLTRKWSKQAIIQPPFKNSANKIAFTCNWNDGRGTNKAIHPPWSCVMSIPLFGETASSQTQKKNKDGCGVWFLYA